MQTTNAIASIIIRTLNEGQYLDELLTMIAAQQTQGLDHEVIVVDSGSTDATLEIVAKHGCRLVHIRKEDFSFGRSLNMGCDDAIGDILVFVSGHCVPPGEDWLQNLCQPILDGQVCYTYGRQLGDTRSNFSERQIFAKYFPAGSVLPQAGFFCNNANAALSYEAWSLFRFDEELTGLEDMALAKRLVNEGRLVGYVADAPVYHHHDESWATVRRRFEREAIALQTIMPEVQITRADMLRYIASSVLMDWAQSLRNGRLHRQAWQILRYRIAQYSGSYAGNHTHRRLSQNRKESFFYPATQKGNATHAWLTPLHRSSAYEGQQSARSGQELPPASGQASFPLDPGKSALR